MPANSPVKLSVKALIRDPEGRVLLIRRSAESKNNAGLWEMPGGKIDHGESFDEALIREIKEETGLDVEITETLGFAESRLSNLIISYIIMGARAENQRVTVSDEHKESYWAKPGELPGMEDVCPQFQRFLDVYGWEHSAAKNGSGTNNVDPKWLQAQVNQYVERHPTFCSLSSKLEEILNCARDRFAPFGIVGARPKELSSFAEKAVRKADKYVDPAHQLTDLAGGRVVAYTRAQADALCAWIEREEGLTIDWANSDNTQERLKTGEFGYLARHYIVQLTGPEILGVEIGPGLSKLKCELQITTYLQHVWSAIGHDRLYKTSIKPPKEIERRLAAVASQLESADNTFGEVIEELDAYMRAFDKHRSPSEIDEEIERWKILANVQTATESAQKVTHRLGRLQLAAKRPDRAIKAMKPLENTENPIYRRDLGEAYCVLGDEPQARHHLETARRLDPGDPLPLIHLGSLSSKQNSAAAFEYYREAYSIDPKDPRILVPFIESDLCTQQDVRSLDLMRGPCLDGIRECEQRVRLGVHLPDAHFEHGRLALYENPASPYEAMSAYARAIVASTDSAYVQSELDAIERIIAALQQGTELSELAECEQLQGFIWVRNMLQIALATRGQMADESSSQDSGSIDASTLSPSVDLHQLESPVLIIAGGCSHESQNIVSGYQQLLEDALDGFTGTIICGGTTAGISGLVAEILRDKKDVRLIGYLPPDHKNSDAVHPAYEIFRVSGCGYTPLGPIQTWADILSAGFAPADVRVLAINGGDLTRFECELALALGGCVATIKGSGRAADEFFADQFWQQAEQYAPLPNDTASVKAFVNGARKVEVTQLEDASRVVHEAYRLTNLHKPGKLADNLLPWARLPKTLKSSNRDHVTYSIQILRQCGFDVAPVELSDPDPPPVPVGFEDQIERMAELEHGRYVAERLSTGWRLGDKNDPNAKTNPTLVPWKELSESWKTYDRDAIRTLSKVLARAGLKIVKR
jgi:mutator protein MutT